MSRTSGTPRAETCGILVDMTKETDNKDATRDSYAATLRGCGFTPASANMLAEIAATNPGNEREALASNGVSPSMTNAVVEALGFETDA